MAAPRTRPAAAPAPVEELVNFLTAGFYSGGFTLPKGRYALEFITKVLSHKTDGTPVKFPRLGVEITAYPLDGGEAHSQFLSMGSKTLQSFVPSANGKGLVAVPGGPAATAPKMTGWQLFWNSLLNCGLPPEIVSNDFSVIDGIWVQTDLQPEPEERKGFGGNATGEAADDQQSGPKMIPVVVEILEGGKPWEGGGGFPEAGTPVATPPKAAPKPAAAAARPPARPAAARPSPAPAPEPEPAGDDDTRQAASSAITEILVKEPNGTSKLKLRTGVFKALGSTHGPEMAQAVLNEFFGNDDALNSVLGELGYKVNGAQIVPE